jgi:hypothetical protein
VSDELGDLRSSWDAETLDRIDRKVTQLARVVASRADVDALRDEMRVGFRDVQSGLAALSGKLDRIIESR